MAAPRFGFVVHATVVAFLFLAPLVYFGESLYWWAPEDARSVAWDEAMLRPGTAEYDLWVQTHPGDAPHCTSRGSDPEGSGLGSGSCCPDAGSERSWYFFTHASTGSASCGSAGVASGGADEGSEGSAPPGSGSGGAPQGSGAASAGSPPPGSGGGAGGGGSGGGGPNVGGGGGGGAGTPAPGALALAAILVAVAVSLRSSRR